MSDPQSQDPNAYAETVLGNLGAPITPENVTSVLAYTRCGGDPSRLAGSNIFLALEHSVPLPVFGNAIGGPTGDCVGRTSPIELTKFKLPPLYKPGGIPGGPNAQNPLESLSQLGKIVTLLSSPTLYLRLGEFLLGALLFVLGIYLMASESNAGQRLKSQAETAATVAAVA